jgi:hypothetical protein
MTQPDSKLPARKTITRKLWAGILEFAEEDVPADQRAFNAFGKSVVLWFVRIPAKLTGHSAGT